MTSRKRVADPVETWAVNVDRGKIVAGPYVRAAATRHLSDLENMGKGAFCYDRAAADRVIGFFERRLKLTGGDHQGKPFVLHDSQKFRIGSLFGWKRKDDNCRRFTRFYDEEGKGNGKSPMLAGIGLYGLIGDGEQAAEIERHLRDACGFTRHQATAIVAKCQAIGAAHRDDAAMMSEVEKTASRISRLLST